MDNLILKKKKGSGGLPVAIVKTEIHGQKINVHEREQRHQRILWEITGGSARLPSQFYPSDGFLFGKRF